MSNERLRIGFIPLCDAAALLITAALGAMVLAHRERLAPKPTQRDLSRQRVASANPAPLPGPGRFGLQSLPPSVG